MPWTVKFDPNFTQPQADIIPDASENNDGVMSKAAFIKLKNIPPGGGGTIHSTYAAGTSSGDQTADVAPANGGPINVKGAAPATGSLFRALTSALGVLSDLTDNATQTLRSFMPDGASALALLVDTGTSWTNATAKLQSWKNNAVEKAFMLATGDFWAAGMVLENLPGFGAPLIRSQTTDGFLSLTSDGVGPLYGGTGVTVKQNSGTPDDSLVALTCNDEVMVQVNGDGVVTPRAVAAAPSIDLGGNQGGVVPFRRIFGQLFNKSVGGDLTITANTIAPTDAIHRVGSGVLKTITVPYSGFTGEIVLIPTAVDGFTYDDTGNIAPGGTGSADQNVPVYAVYDGTFWYITN